MELTFLPFCYFWSAVFSSDTDSVDAEQLLGCWAVAKKLGNMHIAQKFLFARVWLLTFVSSANEAKVVWSQWPLSSVP
jgi:hypothetical protein